MAVKAIIISCCFLAVAGLGAAAYADGEKLGRDDFVSTSVASVFDKLGEITSGEEKIIDRDVWSAKEEPSGASSAGSGQAISDPNITIRGNIPSDRKPAAEAKAQ